MTLVVVMGVSGSGKSTVGALLAARLGVPFVDADSLHPAANVVKMAGGTPLDDDDRRPWLALVADVLETASDGVVVACSALKVRYRDALRRGRDDVLFAHLAPPLDVLAERVESRADHFMPVSLLHSQLAALEELEPGEWGLRLDASRTPDAIVDQIVAGLAR